MMTQTLGFPDETGRISQKAREIYYPIVSEEANDEIDLRSIVRAAEEIRLRVSQAGWTKVALLDLDGTLC